TASTPPPATFGPTPTSRDGSPASRHPPCCPTWCSSGWATGSSPSRAERSELRLTPHVAGAVDEADRLHGARIEVEGGRPRRLLVHGDREDLVGSVRARDAGGVRRAGRPVAGDAVGPPRQAQGQDSCRFFVEIELADDLAVAGAHGAGDDGRARRSRRSDRDADD